MPHRQLHKHPEMLEVYDLQGNLLDIEEAKKYHNDIRLDYVLKGEVSKQVKAVSAILMNPDGKLYLQRKAKDKGDDCGLFDKTISRHVTTGMTHEETLVRECSEQFSLPAIVRHSNTGFDNVLHSVNLYSMAVFQSIETIMPYRSIKVSKGGKESHQMLMNMFFIGYHNGGVRFTDGENCGIETFTLHELTERLKNDPREFTHDLAFIVDRYKGYLKPLREISH